MQSTTDLYVVTSCGSRRCILLIVITCLAPSSHTYQASFGWHDFHSEDAHGTQAIAFRVENQEVIQHCTQSLLHS